MSFNASNNVTTTFGSISLTQPEVDTLVAVIETAEITVDMAAVAARLNLKVNAAHMRWARLKTKVCGGTADDGTPKTLLAEDA